MNTIVLVLDSDEASTGQFAALNPQILRQSDSIQDAFDEARPALWVAPTAGSLERLGTLRGGRRGDQRVLVLVPVDMLGLEALHTLFTYVVCRQPGRPFLRLRQIAAVLAEPQPDEYFISGLVDVATHSLVLYRGDLSSVIVPISWFQNPHSPAVADPSKFRIVDWGHSIALGNFEAPSDAILYDFDPVVKARLEGKMIRGSHPRQT